MVESGEALVSDGDTAAVIISKREAPNDDISAAAVTLNGSIVCKEEGGAQCRSPLMLPLDSTGYDSEDLPSPIIAGPVPPDGGCRAWIVMMASFLCNGIIFGTINSGGVIFDSLETIFKDQGIENPATFASMTLSLAVGQTFFLSMLAGILTDKFGIRMITIIGGAIATLGMFLSSIYFSRPHILIVTMGLIFGTGASLAYTPSLVILGHYFSKRLGLVNGFVTAGSSVLTIVLARLLTYIIANKGMKVAFQFLAGMMSILMVCGILFKPLLPDVVTPVDPMDETRKKSCVSRCRKYCGQILNTDIWKNKKYVIWTLAIPSALFGYFVPYIHLVRFAKIVLGKDVNSAILVQCIGGTSGIGRIVCGYIADKPWTNRIVLQQISFFGIGILTMLLTTAHHFGVFVAIALFMGLFDGCFISLLGPIVFDIVGSSGASQAIGCLLALCSIPLTLGPLLAGVMYDKFGSFFIPFLCAGIPPIIGSFVLCSMHYINDPPKHVVGSPVKEIGEELKNNLTTVPVATAAPEAQALILERENILQVDVRRLANLQRESSV